jgi:hypothetical protein
MPFLFPNNFLKKGLRNYAAAVSPFLAAKAPNTTAVRDMGDINKPHN